MTARRVSVGRVRVRGLPAAPEPGALAARVEAEIARAMSAGPRGDPRATIGSAVRAAVGPPSPRAETPR